MLKRKWIANIIAGVVLCGALVYYNFIDKPAVSGVSVGNKCLDFSATTYQESDGGFTVSEEKFTLSQKIGKICIVNFWETWCPSCKAEMHVFNEIQEAYAEDVEVLAVLGTTTSVSKGAEWLSGNNRTDADMVYDWTGYSLTFGHMPDEDFVRFGYQGELPRTIIVDKSGILAYAKTGDMTYDDLKAEIEKIL